GDGLEAAAGGGAPPRAAGRRARGRRRSGEPGERVAPLVAEVDPDLLDGPRPRAQGRGQQGALARVGGGGGPEAATGGENQDEGGGEQQEPAHRGDCRAIRP